MAKKNGKRSVPASQAIRDYCSAHPEVGPKEIAAALNAQGYSKVTPAYVSTIKSLAKAKQSSAAAGEGKVKVSRAAASNLSLDALLQAKQLAEKLGGIANAQAALDALAKLGA
ncbi:MAG: hypothetical protein U0935_14375 [Pirellulales bacterium]